MKIKKKGSFINQGFNQNLDFVMGNCLNHEEERIKIAPHLEIERMPTKEHREIAIALKWKEFSFPLLFEKFGRNACVVAMQMANDAAKYELEKNKFEKNKCL